MTHVIARITAKPGSADALRGILSELAGHKYELFQRQGEPEIFYTVEEWRDAASVDAHMASPHIAAAITAGGPHFGAPPEIEHYDPVA